MSEPLFRLIYVSQAVQSLDARALLELFREARAKNEADEISGVLLYRANEFMQAIEGPEAAVRHLFERIAEDPRHTAITVLVQGTIAHREFTDWTMGFAHIDDLPPGELTRHAHLLNEPLTSSFFQRHPQSALALLKALKGSLK